MRKNLSINDKIKDNEIQEKTGTFIKSHFIQTKTSTLRLLYV